jgi:general secretion pathway protein H
VSILFFPDGGSTGGRLTLATGDRRRLIAVDWLTGRVWQIAR